MPSYKTHFIHGEIMYSLIPKEIEIDKELLKLFCLGPDAILVTDNKTFMNQHSHKTRSFFITMIETIKKHNLQFNPEIMSFLYGQLDHFVLDAVAHPYIYYMTENYPSKSKVPAHALIEFWIDDFITCKYQSKKSVDSSSLSGNKKKLRRFINSIYQKVYGVKNEFLKYDNGLKLTEFFDSTIRKDSSKFILWFINTFSIGDIMYHDNYEKAKPFLNENHLIWYDPETNQKRNESFEDLWLESFEVSKKLIEDVNDYLYYDKKIENPLLGDISYNTGISCSAGQSFTYVKKYT